MLSCNNGITTILISLIFLGCQSNLKNEKSSGPFDRDSLSRVMEKSLQDEVLHYWYPQSVDTLYGGFLSDYTYDFKAEGKQNKMIVTQSRHTWVNAKCAELYPNIPYFKKSATVGFLFLKDVMWDATFGGFYWMVDRKGNVLAEEKTAYGNAFGIYALAAYFKTTGDTTALNLAKKAFFWMEEHSHDQQYKGYYQDMSREGIPMKRTKQTDSHSTVGYKDQNSSIHLLEAFTELYRVWKDPLVKERLSEMLLLVRDVITQDKGYLQLFLLPDWTPVSFHDSTQQYILDHHLVDHVSFGHDVETAYLMLEASHELGIEDDSVTLAQAKRMVDHALQMGWDEEMGGFYDEGYYFPTGFEVIRDTKNWWAQAEGLNTLLLMGDLFPQDENHYHEKFQKLWSYTNTYLIDHQYGDWYHGGLDKEPDQKKNAKGQIWKGTYHHFRSLINCIYRLKEEESPL